MICLRADLARLRTDGELFHPILEDDVTGMLSHRLLLPPLFTSVKCLGDRSGRGQTVVIVRHVGTVGVAKVSRSVYSAKAIVLLLGLEAVCLEASNKYHSTCRGCNEWIRTMPV